MLQRLRTFYRNKGIFFFLILSYLVVLVAPMLLMSVGYGYAWSALEGQALATQRQTLERVQESVDASFREIHRQLAILSYTSEARDVLRYGTEATTARARSLAAMRKAVDQTQALLPLGASIEAYFRASDLLVTNTGLIKREGFPYYLNAVNMTDDDFARVTRTPFYQTSHVLGAGTANARIVLSQWIMPENRREAQGVLYASVPYKTIAASMQIDAIGDDSELYLAQADGSRLDVAQDAPGDGYILSTTPSRVLPLTYTYRIPKESLLASLTAYRRLIFLLGAISIAIGVGLIIVFVYSTNRTAQRILTPLMGGDSMPRSQMTLTRVEQSVEAIQRERSIYRAQSETAQRRLEESQFVAMFQRKHIDTEKLSAFLISKKIDPDQPFAVALLHASDMEDGIDALAAYDSEKRAKVDAAVHDALMAQIREGWGGYFGHRNTMFLALIPIRRAGADYVATMEAMLLDLRARLHVRLSCGISREKDTLDALWLAHQEAQNTLYYRAFWGEDMENPVGCATGDAIREEMDIGVRGYIDTVNKLTNSIAAGDYHAAAEHADVMMRVSFTREERGLYSDLNQLRGFSALIANMVTHKVPEQDRAFTRSLALGDRLLSITSYHHMKEALDDTFAQLTAYADTRRESAPWWVADVRAYVQENYSDPNLSIAAIAEQFSLNITYLSHHFKKATGTGILDYIHSLRVEEAKRRLEGGASVKEAAEATGYLDSRSLIRAFKRYVGVTPGKYRAE